MFLRFVFGPNLRQAFRDGKFQPAQDGLLPRSHLFRIMKDR
jgi:hypothetical protein